MDKKKHDVSRLFNYSPVHLNSWISATLAFYCDFLLVKNAYILKICLLREHAIDFWEQLHAWSWDEMMTNSIRLYNFGRTEISWLNMKDEMCFSVSFHLSRSDCANVFIRRKSQRSTNRQLWRKTLACVMHHVNGIGATSRGREVTVPLWDFLLWWKKLPRNRPSWKSIVRVFLADESFESWPKV